MTPASGSVVTPGRRVAVIVGLLAFLASGFIYVTSGLVVPHPWLVLLWVIWLIGMAVVARLTARWSWWVLAAAPAAMAFWFIYLMAGEAFLGWRA